MISSIRAVKDQGAGQLENKQPVLDVLELVFRESIHNPPSPLS